MVRCGECQFLSLGNRFTGNLDTAPAEYRVTGEAPFLPRKKCSVAVRNFQAPYEYPYSNIPACALGFRDLAAAFAEDALGQPPKVLSYLQQERECLAFVSWDRVAPATARGAAPPRPLLPQLASTVLRSLLNGFGRLRPKRAGHDCCRQALPGQES